jgi:hypothetical protein
MQTSCLLYWILIPESRLLRNAFSETRLVSVGGNYVKYLTTIWNWSCRGCNNWQFPSGDLLWHLTPEHLTTMLGVLWRRLNRYKRASFRELWMDPTFTSGLMLRCCLMSARLLLSPRGSSLLTQIYELIDPYSCGCHMDFLRTPTDWMRWT